LPPADKDKVVRWIIEQLVSGRANAKAGNSATLRERFVGSGFFPQRRKKKTNYNWFRRRDMNYSI
jgi:hypothetical protein